MPRAGMLEHRATIWRPSETETDDASRELEYAEAGEVWFAFDSTARRNEDYGAGQVPQGQTPAVMHNGAPVLMNDVLAVDAGPESGTRWQVDGPVTHERRQIRCHLVAFNGALPGD